MTGENPELDPGRGGMPAAPPPHTFCAMNGTAYPWYWAWRGWRASTWTFLLWSAVMWPRIAMLLRDERWLSHDLATAFIIFWVLGVWFIVMARAFASLERPRQYPEAAGRSAGAVVRAAAPFAALVALAGILVAQRATAW